MSKLTPTAEQQTIIEFAQTAKENMIVMALAGAAKTSTLVMVAEAVKTPMLCLAFNKRIADEMKERLPHTCVPMTLNSLGHRTWMSCLGKRIILEKDKNYQILTSLVTKLDKRQQEIAYEEFADTLKIIETAKASGYIPTGQFTMAKRLMNDEDFFAHLEDVPSALQERLVRSAMIDSISQSLEGKIDFSDQIFMPTLFPAMFDTFPTTMIDEAQDLSALNHMTLRKLVKSKRLIAVGDPNQAIYGFRGAHEDSMHKMQHDFNMKPYTLSVSFRCPVAVVKEAQWRAPNMQWPEWAKPGTVKHLTEWDASTIPASAAIICRNNAPLFNMAIKLLKNGRYPKIIGNDIGKYLVKTMKKFGKSDLPKERLRGAIAEWAEEKAKKTRNPGKVWDQAACMNIFADQGDTLGDALAYAEHIFNSQGSIELMTGHKSKGLEYETVFILDRHLIKLDEGQEKNLMYVCQTRSKSELFYVDSDTFHDEAGDT